MEEILSGNVSEALNGVLEGLEETGSDGGEDHLLELTVNGHVGSEFS